MIFTLLAAEIITSINRGIKYSHILKSSQKGLFIHLTKSQAQSVIFHHSL